MCLGLGVDSDSQFNHYVEESMRAFSVDHPT